MKIESINPWWNTSQIEDEFVSLEKRELFSQIVPYIEEKQIIAITGLRRTGKTVLIHHLIDLLLRKYPKENIFYYNFDLFDDNIENIFNYYEEIVKVDTKKERIFVFLDEVQKHDNWENELKALYDNFPNIKFFISGSSSLFIEKKTKESLAGRLFSFSLGPLTFKEYLKLKKIKFDKKRISIYEEELKKAFKHYLKSGGFPELLGTNEDYKINKYIKESVVDKIIYIDIPKSFEIEEPELLIRILSIVSSNPGMILEYESLADDLKRNRKTISNYIFYLEKAFLIKKLYNYSKNLLTSEKKLKKFYPSSTSFAYLFNADEGKIIENAILMNHEFRFFYNYGGKEVDFIGVDKKVVPFEVKYKDEIKRKDIKGLLNFMEKFKLKEGFVLTKNSEKAEEINKKKIKFIPLWKWLLMSS